MIKTYILNGGRMKKKFLVFLISAAIFVGGVGMAACKPAADEHAHIWNDGEVTVTPTCKDEGVKVYGCTVSGCKETKTESVDKLPHTWDGGKITQEASCIQTGLKTFTCGVCNETRAEAIEKSAHKYGEGTLTVVPTLTSKGEISYTCGVCSDVKKEKVAPRDDFAEHFYTSIAEASFWQYGYAEQFDNETGAFNFKRIMQTDEEKPAIWKAEGVEIERNRIYSENNAAIAYVVDGDMQLNVAASFTGDGEETRLNAYILVADADGNIKGAPVFMGGEQKDWSFATEEAISVAAGGALYFIFENSGSGAPGGAFSCRITSLCRHMWGEGVETKPASCTEIGEKTYSCNLCGETYTEEIAMLAHEFTGNFVVAEGGHSRTCADCGAVDGGNILPHNLTEDEERRVPATCHSDGEITLICDECGAETKQIITERPDHLPGVWQQTEGGHNRHCENDGCGYVSATEAHNMQDGEIIKPPTATEKGEKESICLDCGYTEIIYLPTTDHTASEKYGKDNDYHWNICGSHLDPACGEQVNKKAHEYNELTELREEATCDKDGKSYWECVCGATKEEVISKDTVSHTFGEGVITTQPTFWAEGVKTYTCEVCGKTTTEAIERKNTTSVDVDDESWKFGVVNYHFPDGSDNREYFTFSQATDKTANNDGYIKDGTEIKNNWFSGANFDTFICIAYTFKESVTADISVSFNGIGGDDGVLSDYSLRIGYNETPEWGDRGTAFTVNKTHSFEAGDTVYFIFKHEKDGWDQGNFSITINRVAEARDKLYENE